MGKVIFDFVGGDDEKNKRIEDAMRKELAKLGIDPYRTPEQKQLEADIVAAPNYTKYTMAYTLIALGSRTPALRKSVETAAKRIGKIEVDHGETSCKTPEAIPYLAKVWARKK